MTEVSEPPRAGSAVTVSASLEIVSPSVGSQSHTRASSAPLASAAGPRGGAAVAAASGRRGARVLFGIGVARSGYRRNPSGGSPAARNVSVTSASDPSSCHRVPSASAGRGRPETASRTVSHRVPGASSATVTVAIPSRGRASPLATVTASPPRAPARGRRRRSR